MTLRTLILTSYQAGIFFSAAGTNIKVNAPKKVLTKEMTDSIREHKPELIRSRVSIVPWVDLIADSRSQAQIFEIVEIFRTAINWSDEQRAEICKAYQKQWYRLKDGGQL